MNSDTGKILLTLNSNNYIRPNARRSLQCAADRWGATYVEVCDFRGRSAYQTKIHLDEYLGSNCRVAYYDGDVLIRHDCPSVFEVVPEGTWGIVRNYHPSHEGTMWEVSKDLPPYASKCGATVDIHKEYANHGLMVFDLPVHGSVFERARLITEQLGWFEREWVLADQGPLACARSLCGTALSIIPPMFQMHGACIWNGWTAEMKTWGYHFCGPVEQKNRAIDCTVWDWSGPDRYVSPDRFGNSARRWDNGVPCRLMTGELTYFVREMSKVWKGVIVELGTYLGGSAWVGSQIARDHWSEYHCVDNWHGSPDLSCNEEIRRGFEMNLRDARLDDHVTVHNGDTADTSLQFEDKSVDLVWIDANHTAEGVERDIRSWWPKIKDGGTMIGHDYCRLNGFTVIEGVAACFGEPDEVSWGAYPIWKVSKSSSDRLKSPIHR